MNMSNKTDADKTDSVKSEDSSGNLDAIDEVEKLKRLDKKLELMQNDVRINKELLVQHKNIAQNARIQARESIRKLRVEVNNFLNKLENLLDKEIEQIRSDDLHKMTVLASECTAMNEKMEHMRKDVETSLKAEKPVNGLQDMEKVKKDMYDLETSIRTLYKQNNVYDYTFQQGEEIVDMLRHVKKFGTLRHEPERKKIVLKLSETRYNDKSEDDKVIPFLAGLEFISDDELVVTDYENRCMKLIKLSENRIVTKLPMNTEPWDLTTVKENRLAVTLPMKKKIQFFNINSSTFVKDKEVGVNGDCRGIQGIQDRLLVCFVDFPKVEMIDMQGNVLKCFQFNNHQDEIFKWPGYVAVCRDEPTNIYVTDKDKDCVFRLSMDGEIEAIFRCDGLKGPRGIAIDESGAVYVNGRASNDLCQLLTRHGTVESLLERGQGLKQPHGITCRGGRVYISSCGEKFIKSWEMV